MGLVMAYPEMAALVGLVGTSVAWKFCMKHAYSIHPKPRKKGWSTGGTKNLPIEARPAFTCLCLLPTKSKRRASLVLTQKTTKRA